MDKRFFFNLCKYALAFGLLTWVISTNWNPSNGRGLKYVWESHFVDGKPIHLGYLALAILLFCVSYLMTLVRWFFLVRAVGLELQPRAALHYGLLGFFYNTFLPGSVGGDIVKAAALARKQTRRTVAVATVVMDRFIGLWGLVWFVALFGGAFWLFGKLPSAESQFVVQGALLLAIVSGLCWLLLGLLPTWRAERFAGRLTAIPKVGHSAAEFWRTVWVYRCRQWSVAQAIAISWVGFLGFVVCFYCCACTLGDPQEVPGLIEHLVLVPVGLVVMAVPLFPGGAGIGEMGFGLLYVWFNSNQALGILGSLVQRVITWVLGLVGYWVALMLTVPAVAVDTESSESSESIQKSVEESQSSGLVPSDSSKNGNGDKPDESVELGPIVLDVG